MAVREGFEPSNGLTRYTLSRRAPSATRTPHHIETIRGERLVFEGRYSKPAYGQLQTDYGVWLLRAIDNAGLALHHLI